MRRRRVGRTLQRMQTLDNAEQVREAIREQYGPGADLTRPVGVLHVTSVWPASDGQLITLKIGPSTPKSAWDFFALNLARARADAIVVTGKILRQEPTLRYSLAGEAAEGLAKWRVDDVGKSDPPTLAILTSGRGLDPEHPALQGWARPVLYTTPEGAERLGSIDVEVVTHDAPTLQWTIEDLRRRGASTVSLEAGPSTTSALYETTIGVDELMLSRFERAQIPDDIVGGTLTNQQVLDDKMVPLGPSVAREEPSGPWRFGRYRPR